MSVSSVQYLDEGITDNKPTTNTETLDKDRKRNANEIVTLKPQ